jgi:hypothetical protein
MSLQCCEKFFGASTHRLSFAGDYRPSEAAPLGLLSRADRYRGRENEKSVGGGGGGFGLDPRCVP